jgi:nucleotide-binding universal stress UspA family protein
MYKHLLIAFDGSELAEKALKHAIDLARASGGRITALNVTLPWSSVAAGEVALMFPPEDYEKSTASEAAKKLAKAAAEAAEQGVPCDVLHASDAQAHKAIVETAQERGCDLIVMGSHGRRGIAGLLLGSVAMKTLTHAHVPVLVYRE